MDTKPVNDGIATGKSFVERVGAPTEIPAALGFVVLAFAELERSLTRSIVIALHAGEVPGETVAAELAFGKKVHLLSSLLRIGDSDGPARRPEHRPDARWDRIVERCFRAESLRNRLLHGSWEEAEGEGDRALRFKRSAKAARGLQTSVEVLDAAAILDVADFIASMAVNIDHFFTAAWVAM
jgi:hypothetical protein